MTRPVVAVFFGGAALFLVPWAIGLARSLPCHYVSAHWGIAWAGFDTALAGSLALTSVAALRRAAWLDRAAIAAATLLVADAWFDVVTARSPLAVAIATAEAVAVELPVALLCIWVVQRLATAPTLDHHTTASTTPKGALQ
jgi:site-specific recombinase